MWCVPTDRKGKIGRPKHSVQERLPLDRKLHEELVYYVGRSDIRERIKDKITTAYIILHHSGMRASELLGLTYEQLEQGVSEGRFSMDNNNKTSSVRLIQLTKLGRKEIGDMVEGYNGNMKDLVFSRKNGEPLRKDPFIRLLNKHIHSFLGPLHSSHSYRISYITDLLAIASPHLVRKAVGHKSVQTTLLYGYSSNEDILSKLEEIRGKAEVV